jgi:hypothetical protein
MNSIICLHRIHKHPNDVPKSYHKLKMTIQLENLLQKLTDLNLYNLENNCQTLVTFDDGWRDVLLIPEDFFLKHYTLQPVIFLTDSQIKGDLTALPLHKLYSWMSINDIELDDLTKFSVNRNDLKDLREESQQNIISNFIHGFSIENEYLNSSDIQCLRNNGWIFASHGPEHSDLRLIEDGVLIQMLSKSLNLLKENDLELWIAWPEGRWDNRISGIAKNLGFTKQFGLMEESRKGSDLDVILRKLW